jgi:hypothetical protein
MRLLNAELKEQRAVPASKQQIMQVLRQFQATAEGSGVDYNRLVRFCIDT